MEFGSEKTQIVVFSRSSQSGRSDYANIRLCGYTVGVTDSYKYLGLTLHSSLRWTEHAKTALAAARAASKRITTVALNAKKSRPALITEYVRTCLVPAFDYGIEFWGTALPDKTVRAFQATTAKPLRAALALPIHTHQLSVLHGCGIQPLATHIQHKQMQHASRVSRLLHDSPSHPTAQLYTALNNNFNEKRHSVLVDTAFVPLPTYLLTALMPDTRLAQGSTGLAPQRDQFQSPTQLDEQLKRARARVKNPRRVHTAIEAGWTALQKLHSATGSACRRQAETDPNGPNAPQPLDEVRLMRAYAAQLEWEESHMPSTQAEREALTPSDRNRRTTAPIAHCIHPPDAGGRPPLRFLRWRHTAHASRRLLDMRARLLFGRSYTAAVRTRFPTTTAAAQEDTTCTHPDCAAAGARETIEHLLLDCPHHTAARQSFRAELGRYNLDVSLINVLNPPERSSSEYTKLFALTNAFLRTIAATRQQLHLPALDGCPTYSATLPRPPPAAARPSAPLAAFTSSASAASLPLDTG